MCKHHGGQRLSHGITHMDVHTRVYLERDGLLAACDVNAVGLSIGHVPVVHVDVVRLSGAAQVVPNLQASCMRKGKSLSNFSVPGSMLLQRLPPSDTQVSTERCPRFDVHQHRCHSERAPRHPDP